MLTRTEAIVLVNKLKEYYDVIDKNLVFQYMENKGYIEATTAEQKAIDFFNMIKVKDFIPKDELYNFRDLVVNAIAEIRAGAGE